MKNSLHSTSTIKGTKAHNNHIINIIMADMLKKKRKQKKKNSISPEEELAAKQQAEQQAEQQQQALQPSQPAPYIGFSPKTVVNIPPENNLPSFEDVQRSNEVYARQSMLNNIQNDMTDVKDTIANLSSLPGNEQQIEILTQMHDALKNLMEQNQPPVNVPPVPPNQQSIGAPDMDGSSSISFNPSDLESVSSDSTNPVKAYEISPSGERTKIKVRDNSLYESSPIQDYSEAMDQAFETGQVSPEVIEKLIATPMTQSQRQELGMMAQQVNKYLDAQEASTSSTPLMTDSFISQLLTAPKKEKLAYLSPFSQKFTEVKPSVSYKQTPKKLDYKKQDENSEEYDLNEKFIADYKTVLKNFELPEGTRLDYSSKDYRNAKKNIRDFFLKYTEYYDRFISDEDDKEKLQEMHFSKFPRKNTFIKLTEKVLKGIGKLPVRRQN